MTQTIRLYWFKYTQHTLYRKRDVEVVFGPYAFLTNPKNILEALKP